MGTATRAKRKRGGKRKTGTTKQKGTALDEKKLVQERAVLAEEMAKSPAVTVTLRIPAAFNDWLDEYRHRSFPTRVSKQALVVEGMKMAFIHRGKPCEEVVAPEKVLAQQQSRG